MGIHVPVKTQKWSDNYQNMRLMPTVLRLKKNKTKQQQQQQQRTKWEKLCKFPQIVMKIMLAQSIKVLSYKLVIIIKRKSIH